MMDEVAPFRIAVPDEVLSDLESRLRNTRWPEQPMAPRWRFGPPADFMQRIVSHWLNDYDWRREEQRLNGFKQFRTEIDGLNIHFLHEVGNGPDPLPIIMTHGWPGSFVEMLRILPMLTDPASHGGRAEDAFTVIVPSIPGYGFSDPSDNPEFSYIDVADLWLKLMQRLGYSRFGAQGGDWGSWISTALALRHPDSLVGLHLNYVSTRFRPAAGPNDAPLSSDEQAYLDTVAKFSEDGGAYFAVQATRPLTLGYSLADSPAGLAAWLLEKFQAWTDCSDAPDEAIAVDDLLTNLMVYWTTNTAHSAARLYAGARARPFQLEAGQKILTPTGVAVFPREISMPPKSWAERAFNIRRWINLERGGHFAALEQPARLVDDMRSFFGPLR